MALYNSFVKIFIEGVNYLNKISKHTKFNTLTKSESLYYINSTSDWQQLNYEEVSNTKLFSIITKEDGKKFKIRKTLFIAISDEIAYTGNGTDTVFSGYSLIKTPIKPLSVSVSFVIGGTTIVVSDNGSGGITGTNIVSGSVDYVTGAISITFDTAIDDTENILVDYIYTDNDNKVIELFKDAYLFMPDTTYFDNVVNIELGTDEIDSIEIFVKVIGS